MHHENRPRWRQDFGLYHGLRKVGADQTSKRLYQEKQVIGKGKRQTFSLSLGLNKRVL